jgi:endogenous inhibitor of DNA gyrase (YacG/DUF329 family)
MAARAEGFGFIELSVDGMSAHYPPPANGSLEAVKLRCPSCKKSLDVPSDWSHRPFCTERCKMIDLGMWLDGAYVLSRPATPDELDRHEEF